MQLLDMLQKERGKRVIRQEEFLDGTTAQKIAVAQVGLLSYIIDWIEKNPDCTHSDEKPEKVISYTQIKEAACGANLEG